MTLHRNFDNIVDEFHTRKNQQLDTKQVLEKRLEASTADSSYSRSYCSNDSESDWDTDLEEEKSTSQRDFDGTGEQLYARACRFLKIMPSKQILDGLVGPQISMKNGALGTKDRKALIAALSCNTRVKELDLQGNKIGTRGVRELRSMFFENLFITDLNLANNMIGNGGSHDIGKILQDSKFLVQVNVSGNEFDDSKSSELANGIALNKSIQVLNLSHNRFMSGAGRDFGLAIEVNRSLTELDLSWNHLRLEGAVGFANGLAWNKSIAILNISFNGFADDGAAAIGRALAHNKTLKSLDLSYNRITDVGAQALAKGLSNNKRLEVLIIGYNPISSCGSLAVIEAVKNAKEAIKIHLEEIYLDERAISIIHEIVKERPKLSVKYRGIAKAPPHEPVLLELGNAQAVIASVIKKFLRDNNLRMLDLFNLWDRDKSLSLSPDELVSGLGNVNVPLSQDMLDILMASLDKNQDGKIEYDEFVCVTKLR